MRIVVAAPPIRDFYFTPHRAAFLGARIAYSVVGRMGHEGELLLFPHMVSRAKPIPLPRELEYLKEVMHPGERGPLSFFSSYKRLGPAFERCAHIIGQHRPHILFISCFAFCYALDTIELAREVKRLYPYISIVVGGGGATVFPEYFRECPWIDHVLPGEAEEILPPFFKKHSNNIPSPYPIIAPALQTRKHLYYSTYISRGCPRKCRFCSTHLVHGRKIRRVDAHLLRKEMGRLPPSPLLFLNFEDDNILLSRKMFLDLLHEIRRERKNTLFSCENGIDYLLLDIPTLEEMVSLGFRQFNFSLGNISPHISSLQERNVDIGHLSTLLTLLDKKDIPAITYFICGFKGERWENALENLSLLFSLKTRVGLSPFYPVPGIAGYEDREIFWRYSPVLTCGSSLWPWNNSLSTLEMATLFRLVRFTNLHKKSSRSAEEEELLRMCLKNRRLYTWIDGSIEEVRSYHREMVRDFFEIIEAQESPL